MVLAYSYVRFSTAEQLKGDSLTRQLRLRDDFLRDKGLTLDSSLILAPDLGVSAFRGKNLNQGPMGLFRDAVKSGRVAAGSYLILENLDRFSRDEVTEALEILLNIINAGVVVVTLEPAHEFRKGCNPMDVMWAVMEFARAHEESKNKSKRLRSAWGKRRSKIDKELLSKRTPNWIDVTEDRKPVLNEEKAKVVRRIFALCLEGMGAQRIAQVLNKEGVSPICKPTKLVVKTWHEGTVYKILTNRACIGEFQPRVKVEKGKKTGFEYTGTVIPDYFPAVVEKDTFVGEARNPNKTITLRIEFFDGQCRPLRYRTNREGLVQVDYLQDGDELEDEMFPVPD